MKGAIAAVALALVAASPPARADEPVTSRLYGTVRLDATFATDIDDPVAPTRAIDGGESGELAIHPRLTRIGLEITPDTLDSSVDLTGVIEADLAGAGTLGAARLRHAFVRAARGRFELIAGQTWDLASPLVPSASGVTMMWDAGNTGGFRPQVRIGARTNGRTLRLRAAAAAGMPGAIDGKDLDADGTGDGPASGTPTGQALIEVEHDRGRLGVWGHAGRDEVATPIAGHDTFAALLGGAHLRVNVTDRIWIQGEAYAGRNATDLHAGSGQSISSAGRGVRTAGGWGELGGSFRATVAFGAGIDDPRNADVDAGGVTRNVALWLATSKRIWGASTIGLEVASMWTRVRGAPRRRGEWGTVYLSLEW